MNTFFYFNKYSFLNHHGDASGTRKSYFCKQLRNSHESMFCSIFMYLKLWLCISCKLRTLHCFSGRTFGLLISNFTLLFINSTASVVRRWFTWGLDGKILKKSHVLTCIIDSSWSKTFSNWFGLAIKFGNSPQNCQPSNSIPCYNFCLFSMCIIYFMLWGLKQKDYSLIGVFMQV